MIRLAFSRQRGDGSWRLPCVPERLDWLLLAGRHAGSEALGGLLDGLRQCAAGVVVASEAGQDQGSLPAAGPLRTAQLLACTVKAGGSVVLAGATLPESMAAGVALAHFGWDPNDYDRLAGASLAGHILARGPLACGGAAGADWQTLPSPASIDAPIAGIAPDGTFTITSPAGSGGEVSRRAVIEALVDGIGDPFAFDTPDCRIGLAEVEVRQIAAGCVEVRGAKGSAPLAGLEAVRVDGGWRATAMIVYAAPAALEKAYAADRLLRERAALLGLSVQEIHGEFLGAGPDAPHVVWRLAARCDTEEEARELAAEVEEVVRRGPPGGVLPSGAGAPLVEQISRSLIQPLPLAVSGSAREVDQ